MMGGGGLDLVTTEIYSNIYESLSIMFSEIAFILVECVALWGEPEQAVGQRREEKHFG